MDSVLDNLLRRHDLSSDDRLEVSALPFELRELRANADFDANEATRRCCFVVVEGLAARFVDTSDQKRQITALLLPEDVGNSRPTVSGGPLTKFTTLAPTRIARIDHADLRRLIVRRPAVAEAFWDRSLIEASIAEVWVANVGRRNAATRLAHLLSELWLRYEQVGRVSDKSCELLLTQEHLADVTGLTAVHVNRMLQALRAEGLITTTGGRLFVHDVGRLKRRGDFDGSYLELQRAEPPHVDVASAA